MTTHDAFYLAPDLFITETQTGTISGVVTKSSTGVKRRILISKDPYSVVINQAWSNPDTGAYSFLIDRIVPLDSFTIICKGEGGENDQIFTGVSAVFN